MKYNVLFYTAIICLVVILTPVYADSLIIDAEKENIAVSQGAEKSLELSLFSYHDDRIILSIKDSKLWMSLSEVQPKLNESENRTIELILNPNFKTTPGVYRIEVIATSQLTGDKSSKNIYISLLKGTETVVIERIIVDGDFEPYSDVMLATKIRNGKSVTLHDLAVNLTLFNSTGAVIGRSSDIIETLQYNSTIENNFTAKLGKGISPGIHKVRAVIYDGNIKLDEQTSPDFTVKSIFVESREEPIHLGILGIGKRIVIENVGNKNGAVNIEEDVGLLAFLYTGDAPHSKEGSIYKWSFELEPSQSITVQYYTNYLPIIVLILVLGTIFWYVFSIIFTVKLKKRLMHQRKLEDGAQFTVGIEVQNETLNDINDVVIRDFVPHIFTVENQATIKPLKKKTPFGTELIWRLDKIKKGDARVISYTIRSKIGISGTVRLASSNARYKYKGMRFKKESNEVVMGTGGETS